MITQACDNFDQWNVASPRLHECVLSCSAVSDLATPWTAACQALLSMEFSGQEFWSRLPFPPPRHRLNPGITPVSPTQGGRFFYQGLPWKPWQALGYSLLKHTHTHNFLLPLDNMWEQVMAGAVAAMLLAWGSICHWGRQGSKTKWVPW